MRVHGHTHLLALEDVFTKVLNLVCVNVGRRYLNCGRQDEGDGVLLSGLPRGLDSLADLNGKVRRRVRETLGRELKRLLDLLSTGVVFGQQPHQLGNLYGLVDGVLSRRRS